MNSRTTAPLTRLMRILMLSTAFLISVLHVSASLPTFTTTFPGMPPPITSGTGTTCGRSIVLEQDSARSGFRLKLSADLIFVGPVPNRLSLSLKAGRTRVCPVSPNPAIPPDYIDGMNVYAYVNGNVVNLLDPMGLWRIRFFGEDYQFGEGTDYALAVDDETVDTLASSSAGVADAITLGGTRKVRQHYDVDYIADEEAYAQGHAAGDVALTATLGAATAGVSTGLAVTSLAETGVEYGMHKAMGGDEPFSLSATYTKNVALNAATAGIGKIKVASKAGKAAVFAARQAAEIAGDTAVDTLVYDHELGESITRNTIGSLAGEGIGRGVGAAGKRIARSRIGKAVGSGMASAAGGARRRIAAATDGLRKRFSGTSASRGRAFLGIGGEAPAPSGAFSRELRARMYMQAKSKSFRMRANAWSRVTGRGPIDWSSYMGRLRRADFREFSNAGEALQSFGYVSSKGGQWLFGVPKGMRNIPLVGNSVIRHELFHGLQDMQYGLFKRRGLSTGFLAESAAHFYGGPLAGTAGFGVAVGLGYGTYEYFDGHGE